MIRKCFSTVELKLIKQVRYNCRYDDKTKIFDTEVNLHLPKSGHYCIALCLVLQNLYLLR